MTDTTSTPTTEALDYETTADNYTKARAKRQRLERRAKEAREEETTAQGQLLEYVRNTLNGRANKL